MAPKGDLGVKRSTEGPELVCKVIVMQTKQQMDVIIWLMCGEYREKFSLSQKDGMVENW
jgi:hypothetical protein